MADPTTTTTDDARRTRRFSKDAPADFAPAFPDRAAWDRRAARLRRQVLVALGLWPMPPRPPVEAVVHGRIERDAYTVERVYFPSLPGHYVTGNLYRPRNRPGPHPGVLCPYGHWPGGRFMWADDAKVQKEIASGGETDANAARSPLQARCAMLARMGCVVFHHDLVGYGDSTGIEHAAGFTDVEAVLRAQSALGLQVWNGLRAVDFLTTLSDVDPARVGITGASGGGTLTFLQSAIDERVAASFPVVMVSMNMQGGCPCENAPLLRVGTNNVELAALTAPRPLGAAAAQDWTHDFETRGLPELTSVYRLLKAEQNVSGKFLPHPHNYNLHSRQLMYAFVNRHLKLGWPEPVEEQPFDPVPPGELSVFDVAHPRPDDVADASALRAWMTRASGEQLGAPAKKPGEWDHVVRPALEAMLVDAMPAPQDVTVVSGERTPPPGPGRWDGVLSRVGAGERVRMAVTFPDEWNGTVVVLADPAGVAALDAPAAHAVSASGAAAVALDVFDPSPSPPPHASGYAAYVLGYNRSTLGERVRDLLTVFAFAGSWMGTRSLRVVGATDAGVWALLATAAADGVVDAAAVDLDEFDFDRVTGNNDPLLLPAALKYGGVMGLAALCRRSRTLLCRPPRAKVFDPVPVTPGMSVQATARDAASLARWVLLEPPVAHVATQRTEVQPDAMRRVYDEVRTPFKHGIVLQPPAGAVYDCPSVFRHGGRWYMVFVSTKDYVGYETHLAVSDDLLAWEPLGAILPFAPGGWDCWQAGGGIGLIDPAWGGSQAAQPFDGRYWLTYLGGALQGYETDPLSIGLAWTRTPDRPTPWTRLPQNPVLTPAQPDARPFERKTLYKSTILWDHAASLGAPFVMYYNGKQEGPGTERIGMALSHDLVRWRRFGDGPVIDNGPKGISGDPQIVRMGDLWVMFYFGHVWKPKAFDTFACSYDLVHWTKWDGPHLVEPSEPFDVKFAHKPWVIRWEGVVYHFYCAVGEKDRAIALATSKDLRR